LYKGTVKSTLLLRVDHDLGQYQHDVGSVHTLYKVIYLTTDQ